MARIKGTIDMVNGKPVIVPGSGSGNPAQTTADDLKAAGIPMRVGHELWHVVQQKSGKVIATDLSKTR